MTIRCLSSCNTRLEKANAQSGRAISRRPRSSPLGVCTPSREVLSTSFRLRLRGVNRKDAIDPPPVHVCLVLGQKDCYRSSPDVTERAPEAPDATGGLRACRSRGSCKCSDDSGQTRLVPSAESARSPNGRNGLTNREDAALDEFLIPTAVLCGRTFVASLAELFAVPPATASAAAAHTPARRCFCANRTCSSRASRTCSLLVSGMLGRETTQLIMVQVLPGTLSAMNPLHSQSPPGPNSCSSHLR